MSGSKLDAAVTWREKAERMLAEGNYAEVTRRVCETYKLLYYRGSGDKLQRVGAPPEA